MLFALVLTGAGNLFTSGSEALASGIDPLSQKVWALTQVTSGILGLMATWWPDRITGMLMERIALVTVGFSSPVYALVLVTQADVQVVGLPGVALTASIGIAAMWRGWHVTRELRATRLLMARSFHNES